MTWRLENESATLTWNDFLGAVDLAAPQNGIQLRCSGRQSPISPLLGVSFADSARVKLQDCYSRRDDLVCVYPQTSHRPFNVQLQYRVFAGSEPDTTLPALDDASSSTLVIEQWISNHTFLLDSHPQLDVELFPIYNDSSEAIQIWQDIDGQLLPLATAKSDGENIAIVVIHPSDGQLAMAVLVHPMDQSDADFSIRGDDRPNVVGVAMLRLFDRFMEKGVIRRARIRLLVSKEPFSNDLLRQHYEAFSQSPLPLTT